VFFRKGDFETALDKLRQAIELNPNNALTQHWMSVVLLYSGSVDQAIRWQESFLRLDPGQPIGNLMTLGLSYYLNGQSDNAVSVLKRGIAGDPDFVGNYIVVAAAYARMGRMDDAKQAADQVLERDPFFEVAYYGSAFKKDRIGEKFKKICVMQVFPSRRIS